MIVNYVQQQGATAIGHWVATGQLTEGSPLACAGAAASQQRCSSGAQGAAASSVLTGLFSDPRPEDTPQDREAKRNLITSIVTGIAITGATHAAIAAAVNNWFAAKQYVQMLNEEFEAATEKEKGRLEEEKVRAKWREIDARQDKLTVDGLLKGLKESGINDINGLEHLFLHPVDTVHELGKILTHPTLLLQLGESAVQELLNKVSRMSEALLVGGDQHAQQFGEDFGSVIALAVQYEKYVDNAVSLIDKRHPNNQFIISGKQLEPLPYDPNVPGGSNKAGNVKVFPSEMLTDKEIRQYAETWARGAPFKEMIPGVYVADASDGTKVTLRSVSSSDQVTKARWTIDIKNNPKLREVTKETVEFKFR
ncbi:hemagglutinin [Xylella fastidiosa subsp. pauca 11399]|uniref:DUF769 domain-containing protein n=1 Tax=Xylella fastidiosa TaxID=2371 RepID=UPI00080AF767|nr:DUF769 domain-containing protein [Xylella fastidiosa]OCA57544.1 hemagglutinin [Xylella fastidiosa subsp. pauca 11399]